MQKQDSEGELSNEHHLNIISIFFASLIMASAVAVNTVDDGDVDAGGQTAQLTGGTTDAVPPSTNEISVSGDE